jgi:adenine-specific DNA-methyltransferase
MGYFDFPSPPCGQHVIAPYIVDFYCHEIGLVIELDGGQHGMDDAIEYDVERTKFLEALGLTAVRYWNSDVLGRTDVVLEDLWSVCTELKLPIPNPLLKGEIPLRSSSRNEIK